MRSPQNPSSDDAALQALWLQVCAARGTPAPDGAQLAGFLVALAAPERLALHNALALAARGREPPGGLALISWAAGCTRPALLGRLEHQGLAFTGAALFACGLALAKQGWDMPGRLAQLAGCPEDVATLRNWLAGASAAAPEVPEVPQAHRHEPSVSGPPDAAILDAPWAVEGHDGAGAACRGDEQDGGLQGRQARRWQGPPEDHALPELPSRFARQAPGAPAGPASASARAAPPSGRLRLRLFGQSAAHTLEVTSHRRGGDFLGAHVVSIDSAPALAAGAGYDWARKLTLQLTPEEMPAVLAVLMGLAPAVRFDHHGAGRDKFFEVRRQQGGLVIVTGQHSLSYAVPVPTATGYYVLALFCRAMAMGGAPGTPALSVSDVLGLARSAHGL